MGGKRLQRPVFIVLGMARQLADLLETARIEKPGDALAYGELALGVMASHGFRTAALFRQAPPSVDFLDFR
jgi:hypothetical protein